MLPEMLASLALAAEPAPRSHLTMRPCEFAETYQFSTTECSQEFRNDGDKPIHISNAIAAVEGDSMSPASLDVPAHGAAYAQIRIATRNNVGRTRRIIRVDTDEPGQTRRNVEAVGFIASILDDAKPVLSFGVVNGGSESPEQSVTLATREVPDFRITNVLSAPDYISASIDKDGRTLHAKVKADAPWGLHEADFVKLRVNGKRQSEVWISVKVDVHGEVIPDANPFALGLMRKGNSNEYLIRVTSRSHEDFRTGAVEVERFKGTAEVVPCEPAAKGCKMVHLRIGDDQTTGEVGGIVSVDLPDYKRKLPIYVWGMLVGANTQVKDFNKEMEKVAEQRAKAGGESKVDGGSKIDLKQAIKQSIASAAAPEPPPGHGPLLKWSVAHEELVFGYAIYRADAEAGPFLRINDETISAVNTDGGSAYQWRDTSAESGKTYWYYVGVLNKDGTKQQLSGPQKVVAK